MPMTPAHQNLNVTSTAAANALDDKVTAFNAAKTTADSANSALASATSALDAAWVQFRNAEGAFAAAELTPPAGYTPPA